ncbi:benzoate 4-monooxygenase cytochrome P450 [Clathrospora elynae]|uniref:Benzoate 4-monooxygenase cytochrome P450 n=1 Tax=Clathrospora elynae TaxID=706981 RepID=A0A6A5T1T5_9PLEO|nr:benzoate 4-monooxygenase cytochrome P450 [Clathrospora elynae]
MVLGKFAIAASFAIVLVAYWLLRVVYNIFFHPLSSFPGPRWAVASYLSEFYYDVVKGGLQLKKVVEMHERYVGPIVRYNPDELHINDPFFYEKIYAGAGQKREKDYNSQLSSGVQFAMVATIGHDLHRQRRGYLSSLFSKKSISEIEPSIQAKVDKLVEKLKEAHHMGETLIGVLVFGALTTDVVTHYAYGKSFEELDKPGFPCRLEHDVKGMLLSLHARRYFPTIFRVLTLLPEWALVRLNPDVVSYLDLDRRVTQLSIEAINSRKSEARPTKNANLFDALTDSSIPTHERTVQRLKDESQLVLIAGLDTTARFLTAVVCYLVTYPDTLAKLRAELHTMTDKQESRPTWSQLETLPYLTAFINEALRCHCSITSRFPRVPLEPLVYKDWVIPAGTSVGASPWLLNRHPDVFPDPDAFRPERWLEAEARGEYLTRYLVTFAKGSRGCLGINLAYAELYLTVTALVQNFDMELVDSSIANIIPVRDFALGFDKDYNFGVNFRISKVLNE